MYRTEKIESWGKYRDTYRIVRGGVSFQPYVLPEFPLSKSRKIFIKEDNLAQLHVMHFEHNTYLNSILDSFIKPKNSNFIFYFSFICV